MICRDYDLEWFHLQAISGAEKRCHPVEKEIILEKSREAIRLSNLRIYDEEEQNDGSIEITAYRHERRLFDSSEQAINRIRVVLIPGEGQKGYRVTVQEPSTHAMARTAATSSFASRIIRNLEELLEPYLAEQRENG